MTRTTILLGLALLIPAALLSCRPSTPPATSKSPDPAPPATVESFSFPWLPASHADSVASRFNPPEGFHRRPAPHASFAAFLRALPLKPGRPDVLLYDGRKKPNQSAHAAVLDVDVGRSDLQQCADAVIRLRAEYLFSQRRHNDIAFHFTSGHLARWTDWRDGLRPSISGNTVSWSRAAPPDPSYLNFRKYLDCVFTYAGTASLARELNAVPDPAQVQPGDVFIQGGHPGHAVIVLDVAADPAGRRLFLIAQSFMPAQDIHVLINPAASNPAASSLSPWYPAASSGTLRTPEWSFLHSDLKRFN